MPSWNLGCHPRIQGAVLELRVQPWNSGSSWFFQVLSWNLGSCSGTWGAILELGSPVLELGVLS